MSFMEQFHFSEYFSDTDILQHLFPYTAIDWNSIPQSNVLAFWKRIYDSLVSSRTGEISDALVSQETVSPHGYVSKYLFRGIIDLSLLQGHLSNTEICHDERIREMDVADILDADEILGGTCYRYLTLHPNHQYAASINYGGGIGRYRIAGITNNYGDILGLLHYVPGNRPRGGNHVDQAEQEQLTRLQLAVSRVRV